MSYPQNVLSHYLLEFLPYELAFLSLPELDLTPFRKGGKKILEHYNVEQLCGYQVLKQADVVMLLSSMPDLFPEDIILKNYQYYEERCVHDSSLSFNVHSMAAARLGMEEESFRLFRKAAEVDLNSGLTSAEGIHGRRWEESGSASFWALPAYR